MIDDYEIDAHTAARIAELEAENQRLRELNPNADFNIQCECCGGLFTKADFSEQSTICACCEWSKSLEQLRELKRNLDPYQGEAE